MNHATFRGQQLHEPNLVDKLGNLTIGEKEKSGYTENNRRYMIMPDIVGFDKFATKYDGEYYNKNNLSKTEHARLQGEYIGDIQGDGFTKSEKLHSFGKDTDVGVQLQQLYPYVNRSLKARDPFYAENCSQNKSLVTT